MVCVYGLNLMGVLMGYDLLGVVRRERRTRDARREGGEVMKMGVDGCYSELLLSLVLLSV